MNNTTVQMKYINGLKGLACLMVMIGHFISIYKSAENFPADSKFLQLFDTFIKSKLGFIIDETFWVILFFFVSGYLVSLSKTPDIKSLFFKSFSRFLRLGLPVLFACAIIFIINKGFGFYTYGTLNIFKNSFIQKHYLNNFSLWQVIKSPIDVLILGKYDFCSPYWVLREMYITSLIIYVFSLLKSKINTNLFVVFWGVSLVGSIILSNVVFTGLLGMTLNFIQNDKTKTFINNKLFLVFSLALCLSLFVIPKSRIASVFFGALVLIVPKINILNAIFSSKVAQFINKMSFGIYSFHWPVLCSFGMYILIKTHENIGLINSVIVSSIASVVITITISILYYYLLEKQIYKGLKTLDTLWKKKTGQ